MAWMMKMMVNGVTRSGSCPASITVSTVRLVLVVLAVLAVWR